MEILILLIVLLFITGLILGPVGFFKAQAAGHRAAWLEQKIERLTKDLSETRTLCFRLREAVRAAEPKESEIPPTPAQQQATEQEVSEAEAPDAQPEATGAVKPVEDAEPVEDLPTTLERLRELRQQQEAEQVREQAKDEAETEAEEAEAAAETGAKPTQEPGAVVKPAAAIKPSTPATPTAQTPIKPNQPDRATLHTRRLTLEEVLAGKVFVWIGAIALVLTAAFLLKLGFDQEIITEPVRVIGAAVFGITLWCVGEWARHRVELIAQALCGAAVAVLYASVLAAHSLYGLLGPNGEAIAFGLMGTITAAAILLSLRHGPAVAILGMLGGFMLPPVLTQGFGSPTSGMILYLLAIEVGVLAVTGKRGWFGISAMTLFFTIAWSLGYTLVGDDPH